jgi:DNA-binding winged helix-turn-helix (wHTH) protein/tetratricopeptide (TPR) repeat protein
MANPQRVIDFGGWRFNTKTGQILTNGRDVRLRDRAIQVFGVLIEQAGEIVTREELLQLWPASAGTNNLDQTLTQIRKAFTTLGFDHESIIETASGLGYKLIPLPLPDPSNGKAPEPTADAELSNKTIWNSILRPFPINDSESAATVSHLAVPGSPAIWNVPFERNRFLKGRDALITTIHSDFANAENKTQILLGLGGRGKTQVAIEYAYRYRAEYDLVWWVRASHALTLEADFFEIGNRPELTSAKPGIASAIAGQIYELLKKSNFRCLFILDNAIDSDLVIKYLQRGSGHVLITTTNVSFHKLGHAHELTDLDPEAAVDFLTVRTRQHERDAAAEVAHELGYLPMALEHAAAYIESVGISLSVYLESFRRRKKELGAAAELDPLITTWSMALMIVRWQSPSARLLMNVCSVIAPEKLPISAEFDFRFPRAAAFILALGARFVRRHLHHIPVKPIATSAFNGFTLEEALASLRAFSLIQTDGTSFWFHELVLLAIRREGSLVRTRIYIKAISKALNEFCESLPISLELRLLPHLLVLLERADENRVRGRAIPSVAKKVADIVFRVSGAELARPFYLKALALARQNIKTADSELSEFLNDAAVSLYGSGEFADAYNLIYEALDIDIRTISRKQTQILETIRSVACMMANDSPADAQELVRLGLRISAKLNCEMRIIHVQLLMTFATVSQFYPEKALEALESAAELLRKQNRTNHSLAADVVRSIASLKRRHQFVVMEEVKYAEGGVRQDHEPAPQAYERYVTSALRTLDLASSSANEHRGRRPRVPNRVQRAKELGSALRWSYGLYRTAAIHKIQQALMQQTELSKIFVSVESGKQALASTLRLLQEQLPRFDDVVSNVVADAWEALGNIGVDEIAALCAIETVEYNSVELLFDIWRQDFKERLRSSVIRPMLQALRLQGSSATRGFYDLRRPPLREELEYFKKTVSDFSNTLIQGIAEFERSLWASEVLGHGSGLEGLVATLIVSAYKEILEEIAN